MWSAILGILFIVAGVLAILFMPASKPSVDQQPEKEQAAGDKPNELSKEEKKKKAQQRKEKLLELVAPGNLPAIRIYYGS